MRLAGGLQARALPEANSQWNWYECISGVLAAAFTMPRLPPGTSPLVAAKGLTQWQRIPSPQPSTLAFHLPPFDHIRDSDYLPAFEAGMREQLREVAAIAHNPSRATFGNTIVALERSGRLLARVEATFSRLNACNTDAQMQQIDTEMAPRLTAQHDAIHLNPALWARVDSLYRARTDLHLDPESLQLLVRYHTEFVRAGAQLAAQDQARLRELNKQISSLTTRFKQNVLKATADGAVAVDSVAELDGLSAGQIGAAARAAAARGLSGRWLITLQNTTNQPVLAQLTHRAVRERIYKASISRGLGGATDNTRGDRAAGAAACRARSAPGLSQPRRLPACG